jgi:hypothetical protein
MPITISISPSSLNAVRKRFAGLSGRELQRKTDNFFKSATAPAVVKAVKAEEHFKYHGTGSKHKSTVKRTTAKKVKTRGGEIAAYSVRPRTYQAHLVIGGTKAHIEQPDGAALDLGMGTLVAEVHHPGTHPNPFVARAAEKVKSSDITAQLGKELLKK